MLFCSFSCGWLIIKYYKHGKRYFFCLAYFWDMTAIEVDWHFMGSNGTTFWRFRIHIAIKQGPLSTHLEPTSHIGSAICSDIMWCTVLQWPICIGVYPRILKTFDPTSMKRNIYIIYNIYIHRIHLQRVIYWPCITGTTGVAPALFPTSSILNRRRSKLGCLWSCHARLSSGALGFVHPKRIQWMMWHFRHLGLSEIWDLDSSIGLSSLSHYYLDSNGNLRLYIPFYTPFSDT